MMAFVIFPPVPVRISGADINEINGSSSEVESSSGWSDLQNNYDEAAKYILKIREGRKLTQTVTNGIIKDTILML